MHLGFLSVGTNTGGEGSLGKIMKMDKEKSFGGILQIPIRDIETQA